MAFFAEPDLPADLSTSRGASSTTEAHVRTHAPTGPANRLRLSAIIMVATLTFGDGHPGVEARELLS